MSKSVTLHFGPSGLSSHYHKTFRFSPSVGGRYIDFSVKTSYGEYASGTLTDAQAIQLRDALIELYPTAGETKTETKRRPHGPQEYKGNGKHMWEMTTDFTYRLRVPGGWIYRTYSGNGVNSTVFVPMPATVGYAV